MHIDPKEARYITQSWEISRPKLTKTIIRETVYDVIIHYDIIDPRINLKKRVSDQGLGSVIRNY